MIQVISKTFKIMELLADAEELGSKGGDSIPPAY